MKLVSHRGNSSNYLENTMESLTSAIEMGFDGIEFDVWTCKSGEIVVFHDSTLERLYDSIDQIDDNENMNDKNRNDENVKYEKITDMCWDKIKRVNISKKYKDSKNRESTYRGRKYKIPLLKDVLLNDVILNSNALINIEIKDLKSFDGVFNFLDELVNKKKIYTADRFLISSFIHEGMYKYSLLSKIKNINLGLLFGKLSMDELYNLMHKLSNDTSMLNKFKSKISYIILDKNMLECMLEHMDNTCKNIIENNFKLYIYNISLTKLCSLSEQIGFIDGIIADII